MPRSSAGGEETLFDRERLCSLLPRLSYQLAFDQGGAGVQRRHDAMGKARIIRENFPDSQGEALFRYSAPGRLLKVSSSGIHPTACYC